MQATIYIRPEDEEAWKNIPNKSQWVHEGLSTGFVTVPAKNTPVATQHTPIPAGEPNSHLPLACCTLKDPCKHWFYNSNRQVWKNKISGEEREVEQ
jgi:hypothetical protein